MNFIGSKELETKRLILKPESMAEQKRQWEILMLEEVNKYYLTVPSKFKDKLKDWNIQEKFYEERVKHANDKDIFKWSIFLKDTNECIGKISCDEIENKDKSIRDVGWYLDPKYHHKGYAYEAALEMLKYMFLEVEIDKIETGAAIVNPSSWNLMSKLGFKRLNETAFVKYTYIDEEVEVYKYEVDKNMFLKELFRKEKLYITEDIDKDPYIKHLSDDNILNMTGPSGSGKSTACEKYKNDPNCIVIDTDQVFGKHEKDEENQKLYDYLKSKYKEIPNLSENFDTLYQDILDYYKDSDKFIIIDCATFHLIKNVNLLKGDIIILRTCINTCYNRCIERYKKIKKDATFEEISEYANRKKAMYTWYHGLNSFLDKIDKLEV